MNFSVFCQYLQKLESISSRLEMTAVLSEVFSTLEEDEVAIACYLMQGRLVPLYKKMEFNLSTKMIIRVLSRLVDIKNNNETKGSSVNLFGEYDTSVVEDTVSKRYKQCGDLGLLTEQVISEVQNTIPAQNSDLRIDHVFSLLKDIAQDGGEGSQERKIDKTTRLLQYLDSISAKFVVRIIIGKLRLGFSTMTMLDALSWSVVGDKSENSYLEDAYTRKADVGKLATLYLSLKEESQKNRLRTIKQEYSVEVGIPVVPALCQRLNTSQEVIEKMEQVIVEPKYDGMRIQLHVKQDRSVEMFTRNLDDVSHMFPEVSQAAKKLQCDDCILDGEVIGVDSDTGQLLPFQQTITRRRKHDIGQKQKDVPVKMFVFDVLFSDGASLLGEELLIRKKILKNIVGKKNTFDESINQCTTENSTIALTPYEITSQADRIREYHEDNLSQGLEGIVSKKASGVYQSGRKGWSWVKTKEAEGTSGKLADTLDLVVMGYYFGRGKRARFGIGAILVGIKDIENEKILSIAKIGTGLSEAQLSDIKSALDELAIDQKPKQFCQLDKALRPDVWVTPQMVLEVAADEITTSPSHSAGYALRFPRMLQQRTDKSVAEITTSQEIKQLLTLSQ